MCRVMSLASLICGWLFFELTAFAGTVVEIKTSEGSMTVELNEEKAPVTVKNFLSYVDSKFYDGTVFHRVIKGFMIQGGGFTLNKGKLTRKDTKSPIQLEAKNGLKNDRGTIAMARTGDPNSATSQFFINHVNNDNLNYPKPDGNGYAVFGKLVTGHETLDKIANVKVGNAPNGMANVPAKAVTIVSVRRKAEVKKTAKNTKSAKSPAGK